MIALWHWKTGWHMMVRAFFLLIFSFAAHLSAAAADDVLAINTSNSPPYANDQGTGFQDLLVKEAFRRIGKRVTFHSVQTERALVNVDQGIDDGNLVRISGLTELYPNIRMVPEKLFEYEFVVFARKHFFQPQGWQSLKPYRVSFIRGWKILEKNVTESRAIIKATDEESLFHLLASGQVDLIIFERRRGEHLLGTRGLDGVKVLEPPLSRREMFLYLHKRHEALIPELANVLLGMKQDGTYEEISGKALGTIAQ